MAIIALPLFYFYFDLKFFGSKMNEYIYMVVIIITYYLLVRMITANKKILNFHFRMMIITGSTTLSSIFLKKNVIKHRKKYIMSTMYLCVCVCVCVNGHILIEWNIQHLSIIHQTITESSSLSNCMYISFFLAFNSINGFRFVLFSTT